MKFNLKLKPLTLILIILGLILSVTVIITNSVSFAKNPVSANFLTFIVTILVGIVSLGICLSTLLYSKIYIEKQNLVFRYGFLSNKFEISSIRKISILEGTNKLIITYNIDNYFEANINPKYFNELANEIVKQNAMIIVEYTNG